MPVITEGQNEFLNTSGTTKKQKNQFEEIELMGKKENIKNINTLRDTQEVAYR